MPDNMLPASSLESILCAMFAKEYTQNIETKEIFKMLPYIVTIVVLLFTSIRDSKKNQPPQSLGLNYFREER